MKTKPLNYEKAGVNIDEGNRFVRDIRRMLERTKRKEVIGEIGGFGGLFKLAPGGYKEPLLVSCTDGVGTKIIAAKMAGRFDTIGIDLVAMSVNDLIVHGAEPLFFLDYISVGKLDRRKTREMIKGIVNGCRQAGCALLGGETAEMPGVYPPEGFDLAGFAVGIVDKSKMITGKRIARGDIIIGLASSGLHSNGYSLVRKLFFEQLKYKINRFVPALRKKLSDELLKPTAIYVKPVLALARKSLIKGIANITGGGFYDNIERVLPENRIAVIDKGSWPVPAIFKFIRKEGKINDYEMFRTFNMGIGMTLIVGRQNEKKVLDNLKKRGVRAYSIGTIIRGKKEVRVV